MHLQESCQVIRVRSLPASADNDKHGHTTALPTRLFDEVHVGNRLRLEFDDSCSSSYQRTKASFDMVKNALLLAKICLILDSQPTHNSACTG